MLKQVQVSDLADQAAKSRTSARLRTHFNLHPVADDPVQRLLVTVQPGSYIRPHCHMQPPKWELFIILQGKMAALLFDTTGKVIQRLELSLQGPVRLAELPVGAWHTLVALEPDTLFFEIKQGPYHPTSEQEFATWAPPEGHPQAPQFVQWYANAQVGEQAPPWQKG